MGGRSLLSLHLSKSADGRLCRNRCQRADRRRTDPISHGGPGHFSLTAAHAEGDISKSDQQGPGGRPVGFVSGCYWVLLLRGAGTTNLKEFAKRWIGSDGLRLPWPWQRRQHRPMPFNISPWRTRKKRPSHRPHVLSIPAMVTPGRPRPATSFSACSLSTV